MVGEAPFEFTWTSGAVVVSTDEDPQNLTAGDYLLEITDANDCTIASESITVGTTTGTVNILDEDLMVVFPNPTSKDINIKFENKIDLVDQLVIYASHGKLVKSLEITSIASSILRIGLGDLPNGIYCLVYTSEDKTVVKKIMKLDN